MDRQTLRDWVHRYNAEGIEGLSDRCGKGAKPRLSPEQQAQFVAWVEAGPDPIKDGVVRWRCADLQVRVEEEFKVKLHERHGRQISSQAWVPPFVSAPGAPQN